MSAPYARPGEMPPTAEAVRSRRPRMRQESATAGQRPGRLSPPEGQSRRGAAQPTKNETPTLKKGYPIRIVSDMLSLKW